MMLLRNLFKRLWRVLAALLIIGGVLVAIRGTLATTSEYSDGKPSEEPIDVEGSPDIQGSVFVEAPYVYPDDLLENRIMSVVFEFSKYVFGEDFAELESYKVVSYIQFGTLFFVEVRGPDLETGVVELWVLEFHYVEGDWVIMNAVHNVSVDDEFMTHYNRFVTAMEGE